MVVIPKSDGPYTVFTIGGNVEVFETKVKLVRALGGYREMREILCRERPANVALWQKGYDESEPFAFRWPTVLVLNSFGDVLDIEAFSEFEPEFVNPWSLWRFPGSRRAAYRNWFRFPRTQAERRLNSCVLADEGEPAARNKRSKLPSSYDDLYRTSQRSWKEHRNNQYHR